MNVTDRPHEAPSMCIVCEGSDLGLKFVDTGRVTNFAPVTHLDGIKYVCSSCAHDTAKAFGFFQSVIAPVQEQLDAANETVKALRGDIKAFEDIKAAIERLSKPAPKVKK